MPPVPLVAPSRILEPFAINGSKNTIPQASQIGVTPGAASLNDGFPPLTMTPIASGGVPPSYLDFQGILNLITQHTAWVAAGGGCNYSWDSTLVTFIGGYPVGMVLKSLTLNILWINVSANNTTNPDATDGSAAGWRRLASYGSKVFTGLTGPTTTLTPEEWGFDIIQLKGVLTSNLAVEFPTTRQKWLVSNETTGAFTVTCKTVAGTGVTVLQGKSAGIWGDGTNILRSENDYSEVHVPFKAQVPILAPYGTVFPDTTNIGDTPVTQFSKLFEQSVFWSFAITSDINVSVPVTLRLHFTSDVSGGNFNIQLGYQVINNGAISPASYTNAAEVIAAPATAGNMKNVLTATAVIPFASLVAGGWVNCVLTRKSLAGTDTNTGKLQLVNVAMEQVS